MSSSARRADPVLMALVEEAGRNVQRSGLLLHDLLVDYPEHATLAQDLKVCEQEGDRITHDIIHRLAGRPRARALQTPATAMRWRRRSTTSSTTPSSRRAARPVRRRGADGAGGRVRRRARRRGRADRPGAALPAHGHRAGPHLVEIHRLENEGDRLQRDGVASLFAGGIDPMVVIRWKDIFESLEAAVDACETVAHVLEGITLKQRRRVLSAAPARARRSASVRRARGRDARGAERRAPRRRSAGNRRARLDFTTDLQCMMRDIEQQSRDLDICSSGRSHHAGMLDGGQGGGER